MEFLKDYKKPPFGKSRKAKHKPTPSTLASSATAVGTYDHLFQSTSAHPSIFNESTFQLPGHSARPDVPESKPSSSSQISPPRSAASYPSNSSSMSLVQKNARTTPVQVPRPRSNIYLNERPTPYDQSNPPGGPSSLSTMAKSRPAMSTIHVQSADQDMAPAIFGGSSARISSELPTASHQDRPCFVSNLPTVTANPSQPRISQPSTPCRAVSLPTAGAKRRLGMGRTSGGYSNKKFKPPTWRVCNSYICEVYLADN